MASTVPVIHFFPSCSPLNMSYFLLFVHLTQYGGLLRASEIFSHWDQKTKKLLSHNHKKPRKGKNFQTACLWKVYLSLAQIDSDSLNPSKSCPSRPVHSRIASVMYILMPTGLDVCMCTERRKETALHKVGRLKNMFSWWRKPHS